MLKFAISGFAMLLLAACTGEAASTYFQLCLDSDPDRREFEAVLKQYADDNDLPFSIASPEDKAWNRHVTGQADPVSVFVREGGAHFVMADNMSMGDAQIWVSVFGHHGDQRRAALTQDLRKRLEDRWDTTVTITAEGGVVMPLEDCPYDPYPAIGSG